MIHFVPVNAELGEIIPSDGLVIPRTIGVRCRLCDIINDCRCSHPGGARKSVDHAPQTPQAVPPEFDVVQYAQSLHPETAQEPGWGCWMRKSTGPGFGDR